MTRLTIASIVEGHGEVLAIPVLLRRIAQELRPELEAPPNAESIRGAKEWLTDHMGRGRSYSATVDQQAMARVFDLARARQAAASFDKLWREVGRLLHSAPADP